MSHIRSGTDWGRKSKISYIDKGKRQIALSYGKKALELTPGNLAIELKDTSIDAEVKALLAIRTVIKNGGYDKQIKAAAKEMAERSGNALKLAREKRAKLSAEKKAKESGAKKKRAKKK